MSKASPASDLGPELRCDERVRVRSAEQILATLDANGELEGLPFMPEMLRFCGQVLRVERSAHKTCDTITGASLGRRLERSVHLASSRCDGAAHGGCQAQCLLFWKQAWLERVEPARSSWSWRLLSGAGRAPGAAGSPHGACRLETLRGRAAEPAASDPAGPSYRCQATRLLAATTPLAWWEPTQYLRDWLSGNVALWTLLRAMLLRVLYRFAILWRGYELKVSLYDLVARITGARSWPYAVGTQSGKTPSDKLDLQPGEWVEIKSHDEILETLNGRMNRGMGFAPEMVQYCGQRYRVAARVDKIINEKTGKMLRMKNDCIILDGVVCKSDCSENRLFCPRKIYAYWREIWLRRVDAGQEPGARGSSTSFRA